MGSWEGYPLPEFVPILRNGICFKYFILIPSFTRLPPDLLQLWHGTLENCRLVQTGCLASSCITVPSYFCVIIIQLFGLQHSLPLFGLQHSLPVPCFSLKYHCTAEEMEHLQLIFFCTILIFRFLLFFFIEICMYY
jgi:hypothetical protein